MELDKEPNDLQHDLFLKSATQRRLVREEVSEVSNQVLLKSYLPSHGCNDGMRLQRYPMHDLHLCFVEQRDQLM